MIFGDLSTLAPPPPPKNSVKVSMFRFCFILVFCLELNPTCLNWMVQLVPYKNHSGFKMVFVYEKC